jgi:uncharacterized protein (DUF2252 family)
VSRDRIDPVRLVLQSDRGRVPELIPLRHGRMAKSPFTFYRGAALNMAADLAITPASGIRVQCGGDSHLVNFRGFATPERKVIFAINDLDETLPAPWEWDLKRLTTSFVVACRDNGLSESIATDVVRTCARSYREHMTEFREMKAIDLWYFALEAETLISRINDAEMRRRVAKGLAKARTPKVVEDLFPGITHVAGRSVIKDKLPTIFHWKGHSPGEIHEVVRDGFARYRESLPSSSRVLLDRYEAKDAVIKVVGVGSVGTRCAVALLMGANNDSLFLQFKEARASVLEPYTGRSGYRNHGERVIEGQRLMQAASDLFLGWSNDSSLRVDFYVRQLRDCKTAANIDTMSHTHLVEYAHHCGAALARAHAKTGDAAAISGYIGKSDALDAALARFAAIYADQTEQDFERLKTAAQHGRIPVEDV